MSVLVLILQYYTKPSDPNIGFLRDAFSDPYFITEVVAPPPPPFIPSNLTNMTQQQYIENYNNNYLLEMAASQYPDLSCIIVYDNSVTNLGPTDPGLGSRVRTSLTVAPGAGLIYLGKYNDLCNKYITIEGGLYINGGSSLKYTQSPNGNQAILYRPAIRDTVITALSTATQPINTILNSAISSGGITAGAFTPNLIDFDINLAVSNTDYNKINECVPVNQSQPASVAPLLWFWVIIALILVVGWALIVIGPKPKPKNNTDN